MKPINLPPSLSTGRTTIVPLLLCNLREKIFRKFPENFLGFDIAIISDVCGETRIPRDDVCGELTRSSGKHIAITVTPDANS